MDIVTMLAIVVPVIVSSAASILHTVIEYKKFKEPEKDVAWETALALTSKNQYSDADDFAHQYLQLRFVHDFPDKLSGHESIMQAMAAHKSETQSMQSDSMRR